MSNLLKALKRAERDRAAARGETLPLPGTAAEAAAAATEPDPAPLPGDDVPPAVARAQRARPAYPHLPPAPAAVPVKSAGDYRGLWLSLAMAILVPTAFVYSVRHQEAPAPAAAVKPVRTVSAAAARPAFSPIPAVLRINEAGPLSLRLDRSVDALGHAAHDVGKAQ